MNSEDLTNYFIKLDALRAGGTMNMFGAGDYLHKNYGISEQKSRLVHGMWMDSFEKHTSAYDRAVIALAKANPKNNTTDA